MSGETVPTETPSFRDQASQVIAAHGPVWDTIEGEYTCLTCEAPADDVHHQARMLDEAGLLGPALPSRDALVASIKAASHPDGTLEGFPSTKVAGLIADRIIADREESR